MKIDTRCFLLAAVTVAGALGLSMMVPDQVRATALSEAFAQMTGPYPQWFRFDNWTGWSGGLPLNFTDATNGTHTLLADANGGPPEGNAGCYYHPSIFQYTYRGARDIVRKRSVIISGQHGGSSFDPMNRCNHPWRHVYYDDATHRMVQADPAFASGVYLDPVTPGLIRNWRSFPIHTATYSSGSQTCGTGNIRDGVCFSFVSSIIRNNGAYPPYPDFTVGDTPIVRVDQVSPIGFNGTALSATVVDSTHVTVAYNPGNGSATPDMGYLTRDELIVWEQFDEIAGHPTTGDVYFNPNNHASIYKFSSAGQTWSEVGTNILNASETWTDTIVGHGLTIFPGMCPSVTVSGLCSDPSHAKKDMLLYVPYFGEVMAIELDTNAVDWVCHYSGTVNLCEDPAPSTGQVIVYSAATKTALAGSFNAPPLLVRQDGSHARCRDPVPGVAGLGHGPALVDPVSGHVLIVDWDLSTSAAKMWEIDPSHCDTTGWTEVPTPASWVWSTPFPSGGTGGILGLDLPDYDGVMYFKCGYELSEDCEVWLYKHAPGR